MLSWALVGGGGGGDAAGEEYLLVQVLKIDSDARLNLKVLLPTYLMAQSD